MITNPQVCAIATHHYTNSTVILNLIFWYNDIIMGPISLQTVCFAFCIV